MIGIDISDQTIKVVEISSAPKRRLLSHCLKMIPAGVIANGVVVDKKAMAQALEGALSECRISTKVRDSVIASIPETQSFLRVIEVPQMNEDELSEAVRWEIGQHIPFGLDNVYVDWQEVAASGHELKPGHMEVQVGAAQKPVVDSLYDVMKEIGLDVAAYELESQAVVRSLVSSEWMLKHGILIIDLGSTTTNVIVYDYGAIRFTASLQQGVVQLIEGMAPEDTKKLMAHLHEIPKELAAKAHDHVVASADKLVKDILGIIDFYNSVDKKHVVKELLLVGGGSNLTGLDTVFLKYFTDVHVQRGNPWVNVLEGKKDSRPPLDLQESVRYATAIGLALRDVLPL